MRRISQLCPEVTDSHLKTKKKIEQNLLKTRQRGGGLGRSQSGSPCHHAALLTPHPPDSINSTLGRAKQASQSYFYAHTDQANTTRVALFGAAFLRPRFSLRRSLWLQGFYVASVFGSGTLQEGREMDEMEKEAPPHVQVQGWAQHLVHPTIPWWRTTIKISDPITTQKNTPNPSQSNKSLLLPHSYPTAIQ